MAITPAYTTCLENIDEGGDVTEQQSQLILCLAKTIQTNETDLAAGVDAFFLIYAASLVFFMQAGFAMLCAGSVQKKNVQNTMLKNLLDACGAALGFYTVGYAFAYGGSEYGGKTTFIGNTNFFLMGVEEYAFWLFQFAFAATSATIVAGTLAERCQMAAYLCYSLMLSGFVYPVIVHAVWSETGFLSARAADPLFGVGMVDFAGSGVVHATGGITAMVAAKILGARKGRFYDERGLRRIKPKAFPGHSVALQVLGSFILWFGWYGFNVGSARSITSAVQGQIASLAAVNTTLAAASGGVASLFANLIIVERRTGEAQFNLNFAMNGCLGGLVCITAGCALIEPWAAIIIGFVAGLLYLWFSNVLRRLCIDDAVDAIPVHMINGIWGLIGVGLFATPENMQNVYGSSDHVGWFYEWGRGSGNFNLMGCQLVGILFIVGWVTFIMLPFFCVLNYLGWFRADALEEIVGLDLSYHGGYSGSGHEVKAEYMDAFMKRKQQNLRHRRRESNGSFADEEDGNFAHNWNSDNGLGNASLTVQERRDEDYSEDNMKTRSSRGTTPDSFEEQPFETKAGTGGNRAVSCVPGQNPVERLTGDA